MPGKKCRIFHGKNVLRVFLAVSILAWFGTSRAGAQLPCGNPIACENALTGTLPSEWEVTGAGDPSIQGFATDISVNRGQTTSFKINTPAVSYRIDIYRLGYYAGRGARKVATVNPTATLPQTQPQCLRDAASGLVDCGNWKVSASWAVPANAASGVYIARLVRPDTGGASHIIFIVRDDAGQSDIVFQTADTTWLAYNRYGGSLLYPNIGTGPGAGGRSYKVSYNRPFSNRARSGAAEQESFLFTSEYPMIRWLESNGYHVSYTSGVDTDRRGSAAIRSHKIFLSVGHDEYWSGQQRANVEAARGAGVHLGFFSGNDVYWKTRWENSIDGTNTTYRTLVCYKETHADARIDPSGIWTGTWRDPRFGPHDGGRPENALTGQLFTVNAFRNDPMVISSGEGRLRLWRNTGIDALAGGQVAQLPAGVLGFEWNEAPDNEFQPPGLIRLSTTTLPVSAYLQDYGSTYAPGIATHSLTLYRHTSGALVFGAGTIQWSWGLDATHDLNPFISVAPIPDPRMRQATVNLFADMGVQPSTLQSGLVPAVQSTDVLAPTSAIQTPTGTLPVCVPITISGSASDAGGGRVAAVEVSTNGGTTWRQANGTTNWTAEWIPSAVGSVTIKSRAVDDSGRIEVPSSGRAINVVASNYCSSTLWTGQPTPTTIIDTFYPNPIEVGVRFKSDVSGWITAIRFYKSAANTGVHIGNLWSNSGSLLGSVSFTGETASGWQEAQLPTPVAVTAGAMYVASYHTDTGRYSEDSSYFGASGFDNAPLHAPAENINAHNGLWRVGTSGFPTEGGSSGPNFWVDVRFARSVAPEVRSVAPAHLDTAVNASVAVSASFNKPMAALTISTATFTLKDTLGNTVPATVSYDVLSQTALLRPLANLSASQTYVATVKGGSGGVTDATGNAMFGDVVWSFTVAEPPTCPCTLWPPEATPTLIDTFYPNPIEVGVRFNSDVNGWITAIRFYKSAGNTGVHVGNLWSNNGTLLGSVTFTGETASGWQEAQLPTPVAVTAGTTYVASYHTDTGRYSEDSFYFGTNGFDNAPLHAPAENINAHNGVWRVGASAFPTEGGVTGPNFWVDVRFAVANQAAAPTFSPAAGTYTSAQSIQLSSTTSGAQIYYTTDGNTPTAQSTRYTGPIPVANTTTIKAVAVAPAMVTSPVAIATYTIQSSQVAQPTFNPGGGTYSAPQSVTLLSGTPGAQIFYTTNGSTPTTASTRFTGAIAVSTPTTLKAIAFVTGLPNSSVASATYAFQAAPPTFSPAPGTYSSAQSITLVDASPGAQIYYTTNGSTPTTASTRYTAPFTVSSTTTINAIATVAGWTNSSTSTATYTIQSPAPPPPPSGLTATAASATQVNLAWTDIATDETGFKIERKTGAAGTYAQIATVAINITSYSDLSVSASTTYVYRVRSTNAAGSSTYSNEATVTTPAVAVLPAPWSDADIGSTGVAGSASFSSGNFTIKGSGGDIWNTADAFHFVYQSLSGNAELIARVTSIQNTDPWAKAGLMIRENLTSGSRNVMVGVTPGNGLTFQRRLSANGASTYTTGAAVSAPYWLRLVRSGNTFTGYASSDGLSWVQVGTDTIAMSGTVQIGLAVTAHNNTVLNQSVLDNVFLTVEPAAPSALAALPGSSSQINLTWVDNSSNESGFRIERKTGAGGSYTQIATVAAGVTAYSSTGLASGTTYFYRVRSTNAGGDSAFSNEASATTPGSGGIPAAPGTLTAITASGSQINLSWTDVANETGYKIERKTGASGTYAQIATVGAGVTTYNNTGLAAGTTYFYRVRATNAAGDSTYSPEASALTFIPSFRAAASARAGSGVLSLTINKPSGTLQGDVMVASIAIRPETAVITASGWTLIRRVNNTNSNANTLAIYYKVAGTSEPGSYAWTFNTSTGSAGGIGSFSGIDNVNPVDVEAGQNTASGLAHAAPSVTTRFANDMIVTSHAFSSSVRFTPPTGMTEAFDVSSETAPASGGEAIEGAYQLQTVIGTTGTRTATAASDSDSGNAHTLALRAR